jgi:hypothetical protein
VVYSVVSISFNHPFLNESRINVEFYRIVGNSQYQYSSRIDKYHQPPFKVKIVAPSEIVWTNLCEILYDEVNYSN